MNNFFFHSCFISDPRVLGGVFLAPLFAMVLFNTIVFVMVTVVLVKHTRKKLAKDSIKRKEVTQGTIKAIISVISVMFMFGVSWLFGALSVDRAAAFFQWPFVILNTMQGFVLFVFFCVVGKDARDEWINLLTCYRRKKKQKHSMATPSRASQGTKSTLTKNTELSTRYAQSYTIRRSAGLLPEANSSVYDSQAPLEMTSLDEKNFNNIAKDDNLVISNGSAVEESKIDLASKEKMDKPRRKKTSSQLPPHIQFKLKRPYYQVVIDQEESIPASSPVCFSPELTQASDSNVFANLTDDGTMGLLNNQDIEYSVV